MTTIRRARRWAVLAGLALGGSALAACGAGDPGAGQAAAQAPGAAANTDDAPAASDAEPDRSGGERREANPPPRAEDEPDRPAAAERPEWLGTRSLPLRADGYGEVQPTPPELTDRRLVSPAHLPQPETDAFAASVATVPDEVVARSTWSPECPVTREDLRVVTLTFWGFDEMAHTGELLVHATVADDLVEVFRRLYEARFPIEEMRIVDSHELDAPPTGDGNNTTAFVCRPSVGSAAWSEHAHGLAVDINPFHNPYVRDDLVLPELASAYVDRDSHRPGMIRPGDVVTEAFADIGWGWGGDWQRSKDWMHFSQSGG